MFQYVHQLHRPQQILAKNSFTVYNEPLSAVLYLDPIKGFIMKAHLMFHKFKRVFNISTNFRWFQSRRMNLSSPAAWPVQIKKKTKRGKNDPKSMLLLPKSKFMSMNYIFPIFKYSLLSTVFEKGMMSCWFQILWTNTWIFQGVSKRKTVTAFRFKDSVT